MNDDAMGDSFEVAPEDVDYQKIDEPVLGDK